MKSLFKLITISIIFSFNAICQKHAKIIYVYDGDTYGAIISGVKTTIRIISIDAPEIANKKYNKLEQPYALIAKDSVSNYIKGKTVKIKLYGTDKYKRTLAEVFVKEGKFKYKSLSYLMIEKGWGWVNIEYIKKPKLLRILNSKQQKAKKLKLGLWSLSNPIEPKEWRK